MISKHTTNLIHGMKYTPVYNTWAQIKGRCLNPNNKDYHKYGGRGITLCSDWMRFEGFYKDMGDKPAGKQIDRIDNNQGYSKDNCHWATPKTNTQNRRTSYIWNIKGMVFNSATDAGEYFGVSDATIHRWCKGGDRTIPKKDCFCERRY